MQFLECFIVGMGMAVGVAVVALPALAIASVLIDRIGRR